MPRILRLVRLGHKRKDVDDLYSHVTDTMVNQLLNALQQRWEQDGDRAWQEDVCRPVRAQLTAAPYPQRSWSA